MGVGFYKKKKLPGRSAGKRSFTESDMKRVGWCHRRNIFISVVPSWDDSFDDWKVEIKINDKEHVDPKVYKGYDALGKMYEYYKYYYDKHKD